MNRQAEGAFRSQPRWNSTPAGDPTAYIAMPYSGHVASAMRPAHTLVLAAMLQILHAAPRTGAVKTIARGDAPSVGGSFDHRPRVQRLPNTGDQLRSAFQMKTTRLTSPTSLRALRLLHRLVVRPVARAAPRLSIHRAAKPAMIRQRRHLPTTASGVQPTM